MLLTFSGFITAFIIALYYKRKIRQIELKNKVHFYVLRDLYGSLWLHIGKPFKFNTSMHGYYTKLNNKDAFKYFGLNPIDYDYLKYGDEPLEVFLNMND